MNKQAEMIAVTVKHQKCSFCAADLNLQTLLPDNFLQTVTAFDFF